MRQAAVSEDYVVEVDWAVCAGCGKNTDDQTFETCHVCGVLLCPSCDVRGTDPSLPACYPHS